MWFKQKSLGCRVLIKPTITKKTESGLITVIDDRRAVVDANKGVIVAKGDRCNSEFGEKEVGDTVYYSKYGAKVIKHGDSSDELDNLYILCNDEDVLLALDEAE